MDLLLAVILGFTAVREKTMGLIGGVCTGMCRVFCSITGHLSTKEPWSIAGAVPVFGNTITN
jgi:hypothetical protein